MAMSDELVEALTDVKLEIESAQKLFPPFNSAHEGWALITEELDELWDLVRAKKSQRDVEGMRKEAIQVAAMAVWFAMETKTEGWAQK